MNRLLRTRQIAYLSALVLVALALFSSYEITKANDEAGNSLVWIPLVDSGRKDTGGENPPPPPPPPAKEPWAFFTDTQFKTASASIVTDAKGGMHLGYLYYEPINDNAPTSAVYLYCASECEKPANWNGVAMGETVNEVQVALTSSGQPRVLFRAAGTENGDDYYYAECNQKCTDPAQWSLSNGAVATARGTAPTELGDDELPQRYFALDPQGRPRFVYSDSDSFREPDHYGNFYVYCNRDCTDASNWFDTQINKDSGDQGPYRSERFYYPSLTFNKDGQPFVLAEGTSMQDDSYLFYVTCDGNCESRENWTSVPLYSRGSGLSVSVDVEVDAQGRPRFAYYEGAQLEGKGDVLWYGWCNGGCTNAGNWQRYEVGLPTSEGQSPDLELDSTGKPHIAYALYSGGGLGYSVCSADCESTNASWQHQVVESGDQLSAAWDVAFPPHCDGGIWDGLTPTLDFDQGGNPIFAYDATYNARCWYDDETDNWEPQPYFHLIQRSVRTFFLPKE